MPQKLQTKSYFPTGGLNTDTNSLYVKDTEFVDVENLRLRPNQITTRFGSKKYGTAGTTNPILHFHTYKVPNGIEYYFKFTKDNIYKYDSTTDSWLSVLDAYADPGNLTGVRFETSPVITHWSTTDFIDTTLGSTIIAAASVPASDVSAESDGAARRLLYYDTSSGKFKNLIMYERLDVVDEDSGVAVASGVGVQTVANNTAILDNVDGTTKLLVAGTLIVSTDQMGIVAYSDATVQTIDGHSGHYLVPVDPTKIQSGDDSYISTDGKYCKINWLVTDFAGLKIKFSYTYKQSSGVKPRFVRGYYNRLLLGNTYETQGGNAYYPWRVRWGELGEKDLVKYLSFQDLIETDVSPITGWEEQGFYMTIVKRNCLYKLSHVGGDLIFLFQVAWKHGCPNGKTLKNYNSIQYMLGEDDVYQWDGSSLTSITLDKETGNYRVKNAIMGLIGFSNILSVFSSLDLVNKEYWLWIPQSTSTTVFVYSMAYNTWTKFVYKRVITAANLGRVVQLTSGIIDDTVVPIDQYAGKMDDAVETLDKIQLFGLGGVTTTGYSGNVYACDEKSILDFTIITAGVYTGEDISSMLITKDFIYGDVQTMDRTQRVELDIYGTNCTVGWNGNFSLEPTAFKNLDTLVLTPSWERRYYYPDCVCYQVRFCLTSTKYLSLRLINLYSLTSNLTNR